MPKDDDEFIPNPDQPIHQGKWTPEEEDYVHGLIEEFKAGLLPLAEGTSLRTFLSKMLNCQPMRISKKFVGSNYNGKQVYVRRKNTLSNDAVRARRTKLQELERKFLAKASPMSAMNDNMSGGGAGGGGPAGAMAMAAAAAAAAAKPPSHADLSAMGFMGGGGGVGGLPPGMDASLLAAGRSGSSSKAAAAGRALLLGSGGGLKRPVEDSDSGGGGGGGGGAGGINLAGFSTEQLAAELEKRAKSEMAPTSSVENFLGSAAELQARASVETLLQNPFGRTGSRSNLFSAAASGSRSDLLGAAAASGSRSNLLNAARNSFHRGPSASNLLNAALQKNSTSNLLNAARNSFHKNSTSNLLSSSAFGAGRSASNLLNANFKKNSTSNLLNAMASSGALRKKMSKSNLLNAARAAGGGGGSSDTSGLRALLASRREAAEKREAARNSAASLSDFLERHNSMDFSSRVSGLMEDVKAGKNWSAKLGSAGSRSNLANLRLSMQDPDSDVGGASSIFGNAAFGGGGDNSDRGSKGSRMDLAQLLKEKGMGAAAAMAAAAGARELEDKKESSLGAEMLEKEALMRQLQSAGGFDSGNSAIGEYLLKQQLARGGGGDREPAGASAAESADEAELRHMLELKRKFLSSDAAADLEERAAKRLR